MDRTERDYVDRKTYLTRDDLKDHIKAVGAKIIKMGEEINLDPACVREIGIDAEICPDSSITEVTFTIREIADPRIETKAKDD